MKSKKNRGENVLRVIVHERMGTVFEISGKIDHSGTILYRVPNVWEWPKALLIRPVPGGKSRHSNVLVF